MNKDKSREIEKRIEQFKQGKNKKQKESAPMQLLNIAIELVAGVIVGLVVGLFLDNLFDSKPTFLIICIILSVIAAFRLIWNKYIKT